MHKKFEIQSKDKEQSSWAIEKVYQIEQESVKSFLKYFIDLSPEKEVRLVHSYVSNGILVEKDITNQAALKGVLMFKALYVNG